MSKYFYSKAEDVGDFARDISNDVIKNEPMFFNSSLEYTYENGGPITRSFIENLPISTIHGKDYVFDSRVHMLMPGWYPAIPGYHHDDVPRPEIPVGQHFITAGQPNYDNPAYRSKHILGLVNADICPTTFAVGTCELPDVEEGELVYRKWHPVVESLVETGDMKKFVSPDRTLIYFDCDSFHQGVKSISNGWRWFGRVSWDTDRVNKVTNEIRRQSQVYLEFPMEGW